MGDPLDSADPFVGPRSPWACWHQEILQNVRRMMRPPQRNRRLQIEVMESREVLSASLAGTSAASHVWVSLPPVLQPLPPEPPVQLGVLRGQLSGSYSAMPFPPRVSPLDS